jgi:hypothetical protein
MTVNAHAHDRPRMTFDESWDGHGMTTSNVKRQTSNVGINDAGLGWPAGVLSVTMMI